MTMCLTLTGKMDTDILIQIVNYNTRKYLDICLVSLFKDLKNFKASFEIIILDNNSNDNLGDLEEKFKDENVSFYYSDKNLGFGGGHNYISRLKKSKYIFILNSDIKFIQENSTLRLYEALINSNGYKIIGPRLVTEDLTQQPFDHGEIFGFMSWMKNSYGASYWKPRSKPAESAWVSGAAFMIESELFNHIGGFDETFFLYKEEEDLCKSARDTGSKILYYPAVSIMHYGHVVAKRSQHFSDSMNYYIKKHYSKNFSYKLLNTIKVVRDLLFYGKIKERL